jgi:hypothetical protein
VALGLSFFAALALPLFCSLAAILARLGQGAVGCAALFLPFHLCSFEHTPAVENDQPVMGLTKQ